VIGVVPDEYDSQSKGMRSEHEQTITIARNDVRFEIASIMTARGDSWMPPKSFNSTLELRRLFAVFALDEANGNADGARRSVNLFKC